MVTTLKSRALVSTGAIAQNHGVYYKIPVPAGVNAMVLDMSTASGTPVLYGKQDSRPGWNDSEYSPASYPHTEDVPPSVDEYFLIRGNSTGNSGANLTVYFNCASGTPITMPSGSVGFNLPISGASDNFSVYVPPNTANLTIEAPDGDNSNMDVCEPGCISPVNVPASGGFHTFTDATPASGCWDIVLQNNSTTLVWSGNLTAAMAAPSGTLGDSTISEGGGTMSAELQIISE